MTTKSLSSAYSVIFSAITSQKASTVGLIAPLLFYTLRGLSVQKSRKVIVFAKLVKALLIQASLFKKLVSALLIMPSRRAASYYDIPCLRLSYTYLVVSAIPLTLIFEKRQWQRSLIVLTVLERGSSVVKPRSWKKEITYKTMR